MSDELERILRQGRDVLPEPDPDSTEDARERALAALGSSRPHRVRAAAMAVVALVIVAGLGVGLGAALTPSGEAAKGPVGFGFLPEDGWLVYQSGAKATSDHPALAVASNLPLDSEDVVGGLAEPSALPYATLLGLSPKGIVLVASFRSRGEELTDRSFQARTLPLRLAEGSPYIDSGTQVRPEEPLGQIQVRGAVNGYNVDLTAYFGVPRPSAELLAEAQRQVDRLVVSASKEPAAAKTPTAAAGAVATRVVDRTFTCPTAMVGGLYGIEVRAHAGVRAGAAGWKQLPFAVVDTGNSGGRANYPELLANALAWATAGTPSAETRMETEWRSAPVRGSGTLGLNVAGCKSSDADVSLSSAGLSGGRIGPLGERVSCAGPRRVLVRVRADLEGPAKLTAARGHLRTQATVREARVAVRTTTGAPLAYAELRDSGSARLFTSRGCEAK